MPNEKPSDTVTRAEIERLDRLIANVTEELRKNSELQFKRMAQLQAEFDMIRAQWAKIKPKDA